MLSHRTLNRTLLQRQHLLVRATMPALEMTEHLLGLQAQEPLPPYLSLWSRVEGFDPAALSDALEARTAVRLLLMRGTIHLVTSADAVRLRPLVQATLDRVARVSQNSRAAADVDGDALARVTAEVCGASPGRCHSSAMSCLARSRTSPRPRSSSAPGPSYRSCRCRRAGCGNGRAAWPTRS